MLNKVFLLVKYLGQSINLEYQIKKLHTFWDTTYKSYTAFDTHQKYKNHTLSSVALCLS